MAFVFGMFSVYFLVVAGLMWFCRYTLSRWVILSWPLVALSAVALVVGEIAVMLWGALSTPRKCLMATMRPAPPKDGTLKQEPASSAL